MAAGNQNARYCRCGNISVLDAQGTASEVRLRYTFLTELHHYNGIVVRCRCCDTNVARVEGVSGLADLYRATNIAIIDTIDEKELKEQPTYSDVFQMVVPLNKGSDESLSIQLPPEIQLTLDSALQRQRNATQQKISNFAAQKKQEFKIWRDEARRQANIIARIATPSPSFSPLGPRPALSIPSVPPQHSRGPDLFQKSPVSQYSHPGASPLAAASLTRCHSEQPISSSPPPSKITPPPIPLSSSLKSPGASNYSKPVKRVMFQDPPDEELPSEMEEEPQIDFPPPPSVEPTISVDGIPLSYCAEIDELFDFDETIPTLADSESTTDKSSQPLPPNQVSRSPVFKPPLSPFRRRSVKKYDLPGDDEDPFDDPANVPKFDTSEAVEDQLSSSSSKPIAITPPSRSFLVEGLGLDEEEDEGGMKELIERISLKSTQTGPKTSFADQRALWDIPGDYYRSVPS